MGSVCVIDGDSPEFLTEGNHTRRLGQGRCDCCGQPILPHQRYHKIVGKWDGEILTHTAHLPCHELMQRAAKALCGAGWYGLDSTLDEAERDLIAYNAEGAIDFTDEMLKSWLLTKETVGAVQ